MPDRPHGRRSPAAGLALVLGALTAATLVAAPPAHAKPRTGGARAHTASAADGSLVYVDHNNLMVSAVDGTMARQVAGGSKWFLPSESDAGVIVAETYGTPPPDGGASAQLDVMDQFGVQLHAPVPTESEFSTNENQALPPDEVRVSPDGTKIAFHYLFNGGYTTVWTPSNATSATDFPNQTQGQTDEVYPAWIDDSHLLMTDPGRLGCIPETEDPLIRTHHVGDGDDSTTGWFDDTTIGFCGPSEDYTGITANISRDGSTVALLEDDSADYFDGLPRNVVLRLFATNGAPPAGPTFKCQITLPHAKFVNGNGFFVGQNFVSPTFSPDGDTLAWSDVDGIHAADVSNLSSCSSVTSSVRLMVAGGAEPYFSPAPLLTRVTMGGAGLATAFRTATSIPVTWTGTGPYDVRERVAPWDAVSGAFTTVRSNTDTTSATFAATPGHTYCFSGRTAGSGTSFGPEKCTTVPLDDRSLSGTGWTRATGGSYFRGTVTSTSTKGRTLTKQGARAKQVGLLAVACPTCGTVALTLNGTTLATVNLHAATRREAYFVTKFPKAKTGTFALKVTSTGKPVQIDGLGFSAV